MNNIPNVVKLEHMDIPFGDRYAVVGYYHHDNSSKHPYYSPPYEVTGYIEVVSFVVGGVEIIEFINEVLLTYEDGERYYITSLEEEILRRIQDAVIGEIKF